jgi:hypothetical protein
VLDEFYHGITSQKIELSTVIAVRTSCCDVTHNQVLDVEHSKLLLHIEEYVVNTEIVSSNPLLGTVKMVFGHNSLIEIKRLTAVLKPCVLYYVGE